MTRMNDKEFEALMIESTDMGRRKGIETRATRRAEIEYKHENPGLFTRMKERGILRKEAIKHLREWKQKLDEKGIKSSYTMVGGKLSSGIKAKTRSTVYKKFGQLKKNESNKPGLSEERQRTLNLRRRLEEIQETDAQSGARAEALDTRKTAVVSISQKTGQNNKPTASVSQQMKKPSTGPVKRGPVYSPKVEMPEVVDPFGDN